MTKQLNTHAGQTPKDPAYPLKIKSEASFLKAVDQYSMFGKLGDSVSASRRALLVEDMAQRNETNEDQDKAV